MLYNIVLAIIFLYLCFVSYEERFTKGLFLPKETAVSIVVDLAAALFQWVTTFYYILALGLKQNQLFEILRLCKNIDLTTMQIGLVDHKNQLFVTRLICLGIQLSVFSIVYFMIVFLDHLRFIINDIVSARRALMWMLLQSTNVIRLDMTLGFIKAIVCIKDCYEKINFSL